MQERQTQRGIRKVEKEGRLIIGFHLWVAVDRGSRQSICEEYSRRRQGNDEDDNDCPKKALLIGNLLHKLCD